LTIGKLEESEEKSHSKEFTTPKFINPQND